VVGNLIGRIFLFVAAGCLACGIVTVCVRVQLVLPAGPLEFMKAMWGLTKQVSEITVVWMNSLFLGLFQPVLWIWVPFFFSLVYMFVWTERDAIKLFAVTVVAEGLRFYIFLDEFGWGVILLIGFLAAVIVLCWLLSRTLYDAEIRRLDAIKRENVEKRRQRREENRPGRSEVIEHPGVAESD